MSRLTPVVGRAAVAVALVVGAAAAAPTTAQAACTYTRSYTVSSKTTQFVAKSPTVALTNDSASRATQILTVNASGTVGLSLSGTVSAEASIIVAGVKASGTTTASASITVGGSYGVSVTARPHTTAYANYGVWRVKTAGIYRVRHENCTITKSSLTAYTPYRMGGHVWGG